MREYLEEILHLTGDATMSHVARMIKIKSLVGECLNILSRPPPAPPPKAASPERVWAAKRYTGEPARGGGEKGNPPEEPAKTAPAKVTL